MSIDDAFVPQLATKARLTFDRHEQKHVILYPERGLVLNETGAAIVKKMDGTRSIGAIADELADEHAAARDAVGRDVVAFVAMLRDKGLLRP